MFIDYDAIIQLLLSKTLLVGNRNLQALESTSGRYYLCGVLLSAEHHRFFYYKNLIVWSWKYYPHIEIIQICS